MARVLRWLRNSWRHRFVASTNGKFTFQRELPANDKKRGCFRVRASVLCLTLNIDFGVIADLFVISGNLRLNEAFDVGYGARWRIPIFGALDLDF